MDTGTPTKEQKQKRFFHDHFEELRLFINNTDLTNSASSMNALINAYDYDYKGREELKKKGWTEEGIKEEYSKRKEKCKWEIKGIEDKDILLGIEAFFLLTSTTSGCIHESYAGGFASWRDNIFDTYFKHEQSDHTKLIDPELLELLENIFKKEELLAQFLKYFGVADKEKSYTIGNLEEEFKIFAYRFEAVARDPSCKFFIKPFELFRNIRNIYAVHLDRPASVLNEELATFAKFYVAIVLGALRFLIYFYVSLCTLLNRAWLKIEQLEPNLLKDAKPSMAKPNPLCRNGYTYHAFTCDYDKLFRDSNVRVNVKFVPRKGNAVKSIKLPDGKVVNPDGSDGYVIENLTFNRAESPVFEVKFSSAQKEGNYSFTHIGKVWDGATIVFKQGDDPAIEYEEAEDTTVIDNAESVPNQAEGPVVDRIEKAVGQNNTQKAKRESYDDITWNSWKGYELVFRSDISFSESEQEKPNYSLWEVKQCYTKRIIVPRDIVEKQSMRWHEVKYVDRSFWDNLESGTIVILPEGVDCNCYGVKDVEVYVKKHYSVDEVFSYTSRNGLVFKCKYIDGKSDEYGECSIIDIDLEEGKEMPEIIVVPEYACGLLVTEIGVYAFAGVDTSEIKLPYKVRTIGEGAFAGSTIWRMRFPFNIHEIDAHTFEGCKNLQTFESDARIWRLGEYAFAGCTKLEFVRLNQVETNDIETNDTSCSLRVVLPDGQIPKGAFKDCCSLKSAFIDVKQIKAEAFCGCKHLTVVRSYDSVTQKEFRIEEIGERAFAECDSLNIIFGVKREEFIKCYEEVPHRRKLVHVFGNPLEGLPHFVIFFKNHPKLTVLLNIIAVVVSIIIYYWIGRWIGTCFGWW